MSLRQGSEAAHPPGRPGRSHTLPRAMRLLPGFIGDPKPSGEEEGLLASHRPFLGDTGSRWTATGTTQAGSLCHRVAESPPCRNTWIEQGQPVSTESMKL